MGNQTNNEINDINILISKVQNKLAKVESSFEDFENIKSKLENKHLADKAEYLYEEEESKVRAGYIIACEFYKGVDLNNTLHNTSADKLYRNMCDFINFADNLISSLNTLTEQYSAFLIDDSSSLKLLKEQFKISLEVSNEKLYSFVAQKQKLENEFEELDFELTDEFNRFTLTCNSTFNYLLDTNHFKTADDYQEYFKTIKGLMIFLEKELNDSINSLDSLCYSRYNRLKEEIAKLYISICEIDFPKKLSYVEEDKVANLYSEAFELEFNKNYKVDTIQNLEEIKANIKSITDFNEE